MVRLIPVFFVLSLIFSPSAVAKPGTKGKPVLAEMQNLFSLIQTLKRENSELKNQLKAQESVEVRPAVAKPAKNDPSLVIINKGQYEVMVKQLEHLKTQNVAKEKMILEMEQGID